MSPRAPAAHSLKFGPDRDVVGRLPEVRAPNQILNTRPIESTLSVTVGSRVKRRVLFPSSTFAVR